MRLLEYEAKAILQNFDIPVPRSFITKERPDFLPAVIKSQVPTGGRGKAGGIAIAWTDGEYRDAVRQVKTLEIKGLLPRTLLAEELLSIDRELYLSLLIDKQSASIMLMAHTNGGVEVEDNPEDSYLTLSLGAHSDIDTIGEKVAEYYGLENRVFVIQDLIKKLYICFTGNDLLLLEINPLVVTAEGLVIAADCKMEVDDAASWRHPDWSFEAAKSETNFITLDQEGNVATVANGAGLAMATVDAVADAGLRPANFLDIGGGANETSILAAFQRLVAYPNLRVIIVNIFAGITRCDEVAGAIIAARSQIPGLPPLAVRLAGTNYDTAAMLLSQHNITTLPSLEKAIEAAEKES